MKQLPKGFPTHTKDITGRQICLGDKVTYDFDDNTSSFEVVFEDNAFRKKYRGWDRTLEKPILEYGNRAKAMRLKLIKPATTQEIINKVKTNLQLIKP